MPVSQGKKERIMPPKHSEVIKVPKEFIGRKFHMLTVGEYAEFKDGRVHWLCTCDCGNKKLIAPSTLITEKYPVKSCGCSQYAPRRPPGYKRIYKPWSERKKEAWASPARQKQRYREKIEWHKENNLCILCHKENDRDKGLTCKVCTEKRNIYLIEYKKGKMEKGLCIRCGKEKSEERKAFIECTECAKAPIITPEERLLKLLQLYELSPEEYNQMLENQEGTCAICQEVTKTLNIDHCHITGKVRGILCGNCNRALGLFKDSPNTLGNAIAYLHKHQE
jgi:Recombination endonuclease VII